MSRYMYLKFSPYEIVTATVKVLLILFLNFSKINLLQFIQCIVCLLLFAFNAVMCGTRDF